MQLDKVVRTEKVKLAGLQYVRHMRGMTQKQLAKNSGVSRPTIQRLELQKTTARGVTVHKLAHALEVPPAQLVLHERFTDDVTQGWVMQNPDGEWVPFKQALNRLRQAQQ